MIRVHHDGNRFWGLAHDDWHNATADIDDHHGLAILRDGTVIAAYAPHRWHHLEYRTGDKQ